MSCMCNYKCNCIGPPGPRGKRGIQGPTGPQGPPGPPGEKSLCRRLNIEHKTQLVPPAKKGTTKVKKNIRAYIEKVCDEVVVIKGVLVKEITYITMENSIERENTLVDEVPFHCIIDRDDIKEKETYSVCEKRILCEVYSTESAFTESFNDNEQLFAFRLDELDIVKICIEKKC